MPLLIKFSQVFKINFYLGIVKESVRTHFLISNVFVGNLILCFGQHVARELWVGQAWPTDCITPLNVSNHLQVNTAYYHRRIQSSAPRLNLSNTIQPSSYKWKSLAATQIGSNRSLCSVQTSVEYQLDSKFRQLSLNGKYFVYSTIRSPGVFHTSSLVYPRGVLIQRTVFEEIILILLQ